MIKLIKGGSNKIGIDGAIAFTILSRVIQAVGGVVTLIFIAKCLTKVEQGYYFTFGSILGIQVFFELGLSGIITLFVAHENANLVWNDRTSFKGSPESSSRLASLLRFTIKWFGVIAILLFFGLLISGYFFFGKYGKSNTLVEWQIPWMILSVTTSLTLMASPIMAFFEGLGRVKEVAQIRMLQQIVQLSFVLILYSLGFKLFSAPVASFLSFLIVPIWIFFGIKKKLLVFVWNKIGKYHVNYRMEIFPFQWKIALSWISSYFMFQFFNPVLFATEGAIVAGQMGMTLAILNAILYVPLSWINTKVPMFSSLIAKKEYINLDIIFNKTLRQTSIVLLACLLIFISFIYVIKVLNVSIGNRFLPLFPIILLSIATFVNQFVSAFGTYLRCHKQEPFLAYSIVMAILTTLSTLILGKFFGVFGIALGYCVLTVTLGLFWVRFIFIKKKKLWHT